MSELIEAKGSCLCGAIRFTARKVSKSVGACHCGMCRKWGGGPLMAVNSGGDVSFEGEENISVYDSSPWAERAFCEQCGSHLFYRLKESNQHFIPVGIFENQESFVFDNQVFIDKKPSFYSFANKTNDMTEAEVFEKYGAS
jgi:hypothetical protein